jgi:hypothetical protein
LGRITARTPGFAATKAEFKPSNFAKKYKERNMRTEEDKKSSKAVLISFIFNTLH